MNFVGTGGQYAWCCNGADLPFTYNGSVFALTPAITGITPQDVINVNIHKNRIWMCLVESTKVAYLDVDAIGGLSYGIRTRRTDVQGRLRHGDGHVVARCWIWA
ncbi:hypothetical protein HB770_20850 [Rhizobium leguminosarum bv. viciae]|uniref:Uncharacterized protein n=1 Tax=Rhizobium leguminosarum bv. viciae TaxID=387 RepID=A0A7G6RL27_RHILV|nr:hypothetical protein HB770_20850 [Rhizobium leguminosarum bv. viciae]